MGTVIKTKPNAITTKIILVNFIEFKLYPIKKTKAIGNKNTIMLYKIKVKKLGFSKGCASFAPKNPPPFEPNSFIGKKAATGPVATVLLSPCIVVIWSGPLKVMGTPPHIKRIAVIIHIG